jgi:hypothetical protein
MIRIGKRSLGCAALLAALSFMGQAQAQFLPPVVQSCSKSIGNPNWTWSGLHSCLGIQVEARSSSVSIPRPPISPIVIVTYEMRARLNAQPGAYLTAGVSMPGAPQCTYRVTSTQWTAWTVCGGGPNYVKPPALTLSGSWLVSR